MDNGSVPNAACVSLVDKQQLHLINGYGCQNNRRYRRTCCPPWVSVIFSALGAILLVILLFGSLLGSYIMWSTDILEDTMHDMLIIRNGSPSFENWRSPPVHPIMRLRVFNYTNVDDFIAGNAEKLLVEEVGPYVFREWSEKVNISFGDNDTTVSYRINSSYTFVPELSNGTMNDTLYVLNAPLLTAFAHSRNVGYFTRMALRAAMRALGAAPFHTRTAQEMFWGYSDPLIRTIQNFLGPFSAAARNLKVGLLEVKQGVSEDLWTVFTGEGDGGLNRLGLITRFNGLSEVDYYRGEECNQIEGSDGSRFPPPLVNAHSHLWVYLRETCQRTALVFNSTVSVMDGFPAMRFHPEKPMPDDEEENCYCSEEEGCLPYGTLDSSPCRGGSPIIVSAPHFCRADPQLLDVVDGLSPDPLIHDPYLVIHQRMGVPVAGKSQFQFNVKVHSSGGYSYMDPLVGKILPIVWLERDIGDFPPELRQLLYFTAVTLDQVKSGLKTGLPVLAAVAGLSLILMVALHCRRRNCHLCFDSKTREGTVLTKVQLQPMKNQITRL